MSNLADDPIFRGWTLGGMSCEDFVRAVRKHAFSERKARDNEYTADYAMTCLTDDALHWSETLPLDVRSDWGLLRPALLAKYGSTGQQISLSSVPIPSAMVPIPAAASPIQPMHSVSSAPAQVPAVIPGIRRGRIRIVTGLDSYFLEIDNGWYVGSQNKSGASVFDVVDTPGGVELRHIHPALSSGNWLGMVPGPYDSRAALFLVERHGPEVAPCQTAQRSGWSGAASVVQWTRSVDGTLFPAVGAKGGILMVFMRKSNRRLLFIDCDSGDGREKVIFAFEPL